ncbi:MAG: hypothetical protein WA364_11670 [Candidatus Nitrosopolaris sp.]
MEVQKLLATKVSKLNLSYLANKCYSSLLGPVLLAGDLFCQAKNIKTNGIVIAPAVRKIG